MSKHGRSTANPRSESKRARIQSWLMQNGWTIAEVDAPEAVWVISGSNPAGHVVLVAQDKKAADRLVLQGAVNVDPTIQRQIAAMDAPKRDALLWQLRFGLLNIGLEFQGVAEPLTSANSLIGRTVSTDILVAG